MLIKRNACPAGNTWRLQGLTIGLQWFWGGCLKGKIQPGASSYLVTQDLLLSLWRGCERLSGLCHYGQQMVKQLLKTLLCGWRERALSCWEAAGILQAWGGLLQVSGGAVEEAGGLVCSVKGLRKEGGKWSCDLSLPCFIPDSCLGFVSAPYNKVEQLKQFQLVLCLHNCPFAWRSAFDPFLSQSCAEGLSPALAFAVLVPSFRKVSFPYPALEYLIAMMSFIKVSKSFILTRRVIWILHPSSFVSVTINLFLLFLGYPAKL